jgi:two-component system phosphate regulon response regulator PhoB
VLRLQAPVRSTTRTQAEGQTGVTTRRRILLIDDTPEIAELLTFALRDRGYDVVSAGFTDTINDLVQEHRAEAVVIDCSIYDMSEALFDLLRSHLHHQALPVVIISDTPEKADVSLQARSADHVLLIPKPFSGGQVSRALDELLSRPS